MKAVFITEGGIKFGFGHITRCIAISQGFKEKKIKSLFIVNGDNTINSFFKKKEYIRFNWITYQKKLLSYLYQSDIIVIDSYQADKKFYQQISEKFPNCVYLDDNNRIIYPKGIVINGNIYGHKIKFPKNKDIVYLIGPQYAPIRKEFWTINKSKISKNINKILITFGGTDKKNLTNKILLIIHKYFPKVYKYVIIGPGFNSSQQKNKLKNKSIVYINKPNIKKISKLMSTVDLSITTTSQTTLELMRFGKPIIGFIVAKNQEKIAYELSSLKLSNSISYNDKDLEEKLILEINRLKNYSVRKSIFNKSLKIVDGQGVRRIVDKLTNKTRILFLTNNPISNRLINWLSKDNVVFVYNDKINPLIIQKHKPDLLISYNYRYIINEDVLKLFKKGRAINLHISYLPWNRGSNPNFWSFIDNTPKGVTIHSLDKKLDSGDILVQKIIHFNEKNETLKTTYLKLNNEIQNLFIKNWFKIKQSNIKLIKQSKIGTNHTLKEYDRIKPLLNKDGWDTSINKLKTMYEEYKNRQ